MRLHYVRAHYKVLTLHTASYTLREYGTILNKASIQVDAVSCTGSETKLVDCNYNTNEYCRTDEAAVICTGEH